MDQTFLPTLLVLIPAISALGLYPLLARTDRADRRWIRGLGGGLIGLLLVLLGVLAATDVPEWPASRLDSLIASATYVLLAGGILACAGWSIASRNTWRSLWAFLLMLAANAGLLLFLDAPFVATAMLLLAAGTAAAGLKWPGWIRVAKKGTVPFAQADSPLFRLFCREPLLACIAGALLAVALIGAVHRAWAVEAFPDSESRAQSALPRFTGRKIDEKRSRSSTLNPQSSTPSSESMSSRFDYRLLHNSLVVGALLFAAGAVGWVGRRDRVALVLSAGIMLQGVVLSLCAFGRFHGSETGQMWSLGVLAVGAIVAGFALAMGKTTCTSW